MAWYYFVMVVITALVLYCIIGAVIAGVAVRMCVRENDPTEDWWYFGMFWPVTLPFFLAMVCIHVPIQFLAIPIFNWISAPSKPKQKSCDYEYRKCKQMVMADERHIPICERERS